MWYRPVTLSMFELLATSPLPRSAQVTMAGGECKYVPLRLVPDTDGRQSE